jgi:NADH-quinone oxidoreductase subunit C
LSSADDGATTTEDAAETTDAPEATEPEEAVEVDERREAVVESLRGELGDALVDTHVDPGRELWARVSLDSWVTTGTYARDGLGCHYFEFLSAIDWMPSPFGRDMDAQEDLVVSGATPKEQAPIEQGYAGGTTRFQVIARLYDISTATGIHLKVDLPDDDLTIGTWSSTFLGANWHEREAFEMFGITFDGHPHLIKLYLPLDFQGFPLRKDFPLLARRVRPWPGIVDVEPMPGGDEPEGDGE